MTRLDSSAAWTRAAVVTLGLVVVPVGVAVQGPAPGKPEAALKWTAPRTADGHPDLQGVWDFGTLTPLERPAALGDKAVFSNDEAAAFEQKENRRQNRDLIDPAKGGLNYPPGGVVPYNEFWYERSGGKK
jgi:hypothetical protein